MSLFCVSWLRLAMKPFGVKAHGVLLLLYVVFWVGWLVLCSGQLEEPSSIAPMEKGEKEALYSAIKGFVSEHWNGSDLYPDPCGWTPIQGVSCDLFNGYWYVTTISIGPILDNSLQCNGNAKFTHHLFKLKHLKSLQIFNCFNSPTQNPTKIPVSSWETLSNTLQSLEFRSNPGLIGTIPFTIGYLKALQSLVLLENGLTGSIPAHIGNLSNLRRLVLAGNRFTGQIPESFGGLNELLILDASRNFLSGSLPLTFGGLASLLKLDLSQNMLQGQVPKEIGTLKNLTLMDLGGNRISGGLVQSIQEMTSLKELVMSNNPIGGDLTVIKWENLQNLEMLDLSNTGLMGAIPDSMAELKKLRYLGLAENNLAGCPSPKLAALPNINALYIHGNDFKGKLEFPDSFYRRMERRFGAWNNPNLCYKVVSMSNDYVPFGLKPCQEDPNINGV